jgi:pterin-4a-carbinolamine dehydratase
VNSFLHQLFDILKVAHHPLLEVLLSVPDLNLVRHLTSDLVDNDQNSAHVSILALSISFDILKVAHHPLLEVLSSIPNVNLVCHLTSDLVDNDRNSAHVSILTLSISSGVYAAAFHHHKIH